jgi:hypothetical protein
MTRRGPQAGGFFLFVGILGGLIWGTINGEATRGVLFGTLAGVAAALFVWLMDRRR